MIRVPYERLVAEMQKVLVKKGYTEERAEMVAKIFADNSLAGVPTHGFNRFARAVFYLNKGMIDPKAEPEVLISSGAFERWDGHRGFGPLNCAGWPWTGPATWRSSTVSAWWLWGTTITGCGVRLTDSRRRTVA